MVRRGTNPWQIGTPRNRGIAAVAMLAAAAGGAGCTPFVVGPDYAGVGLLRQGIRTWAGGARYDEVRGVGVLAMDGAIRVGYVRAQRLVCPIGDGASYRVEAPIGVVAVGEEAGAAAAELAGESVEAGAGTGPKEVSP